MELMRIELFSRIGIWGRKHYFRVRTANGQIVAHSEAYSRKIDARSTAESLVRNLSEAPIVEE